ncbi:MAG TPA: hypothetical protein ENI95_10575 [Chloroflexi bacterium]|nr:hypothetical protein [Chloroflexota bacterium]
MASTRQAGRRTPRREYVEATHTSVVVAGILVAVGGWSGLIWLLSNTLPTVPNRWVFYALLQIALTGTALPFVRFLNQRFSRERGLFLRPGVLVRQATWVGLFGTTCAWLRIPRLLSVPLAIVIALALIAIEALLRLRERAAWRPE